MNIRLPGLRSRLATGFAVLVAISLGMAAFGISGLSNVTASVAKMEAISGNVVRIQAVMEQFEIIRRAASQFRIDADANDLNDITHAEASAAGLLTDAAAATLSEQRRKLYNGIGNDLRKMVVQRAAFVHAYQTGFAERAKLFTAGDALTLASNRMVDAANSAPAAEQSAAARAGSAVLLVRVANWRFLATLDPKGPATFKKNNEKAEVALADLAKLAGATVGPLIGPVRDDLAGYAASFDRASASLIEGADVQKNGLQPLIAVMQRDAAAAMASLQDAFKANFTASQATADNTMRLQFAVGGAAAVMAALLAFLIGRSIVRPIAGMTGAMTRLAQGDHNVDVPGRTNTDEIGQMARAVEVFKENAIENRRMAEAKVKEQAARDRRQVAMDSHTQDSGASVSGVMASLAQSAGRMHEAAREMADAAKHTRDSTAGAVEGAQASARDLNTVAVAAEEMAASINEINRQVAQVSAAVARTVERASETDKKVLSLSEAANRIGDVLRLINEIARQTNLLALNATIEAARAGEAGKGFAVVASEVKTLASQTSAATDQIAAQIAAIRTSTDEAVDAVRDVGAAIDQVASVATAIAAAVEQQATATQEISATVQTITRSTTVAAEAMGQVRHIAERTDKASASVVSAADEVGHTADSLRGEVNDFLSAMRQDNQDERRAYERIPGDGATLSLTIGGAREEHVRLKDISLGGAALTCRSTAPAGAEVQVDMPGGGSVLARVVRTTDGLLSVAFRQDAANLTAVHRLLESIKARSNQAAA